MITFYGKLLENFPNEKNFFDVEPYSIEIQDFFREALAIIKELTKSKLNSKQKEFLLLILEGRRIYDISQIFGRSNGTAHQNYNLMVKKISLALIKNKKFIKLIEDLSEGNLKKNLKEWLVLVKKKYNLRTFYCPICKDKFKNKYHIKKHILKINDKTHNKYYDKQLKFINEKLERDGFNVDWIYEMEDELLFSLSWIFELWKKKYKKDKGVKR